MDLFPLMGDQSTAARLRRFLRAHPTFEGDGILENPGREIAEGRARLAKVYQGITAANYDGLELQTAGIGEIKFHKLKFDNGSVIEPDEQPTKAYSILDSAMPDKTEVICFRVLNIKDPANPHTPQPGWVAIPVGASEERPRGYGVFRSSGNSSGTQTGLVNCTTTDTDSFNSSDIAPVIQFQVAAGGPPDFDRIVVNQPGIYRFTFTSRIRFSSPGEPPGGVFSYQDKVGTVTSNGVAIGAGNVIGTTEDFCQSRLFRRERFCLVKNQNFGAPATTDQIALGEPWAIYECGELIWDDPFYSLPVLMDAGDTLSIWLDVSGRKGSHPVSYNVEFSIHFSNYEPNLSP